jgi:serine/threonine-protein kinase RsbW
VRGKRPPFLVLGPEPEIELRLKAEPEWVSAARAVAFDAALRADFDTETAEDIRLAVDEAGNQLMPVVATRHHIDYTFAIAPHRLDVTVAGDSHCDPRNIANSFGFQVLGALADALRLDCAPAEGGLQRVRITVGIRRTPPMVVPG